MNYQNNQHNAQESKKGNYQTQEESLHWISYNMKNTKIALDKISEKFDELIRILTKLEERL